MRPISNGGSSSNGAARLIKREVILTRAEVHRPVLTYDTETDPSQLFRSRLCQVPWGGVFRNLSDGLTTGRTKPMMSLQR